MTMNISTQDIFDTSQVDKLLLPLLDIEKPWQILSKLDEFLLEIENYLQNDLQGDIHPSAVITGKVFLAAGAKVKAHALIEGPAWIGSDAVVGHGAYLRGGVVLASKAKVGHSSEVKHSVMLNGAQAPHFNYVGDAIIGSNANLGAGVKLANLTAFGKNIKVANEDIGLRKFSAAVGDGAFIGCNAVLAPGTIIGPRVVTYNCTMLRGIYPADSIVKLRQSLEVVEKC